MPQFKFEAKAVSGQLVRGEVEAATEQEARVRLRSQGFEPTKISVESVSQFSGLKLLGERVKDKDLQVFTRQLSTLINAGVHLVQGLELLANGTKNVYFQKVLKTVVEDVGKGKSLAVALSRYPKVFDRLFLSMVRAGEEGGVLDVVLMRLAQYIEKATQLKGKVVGALWYPAAIIVVAVIVIVGILTFVIPQFEDLFKSSGNELPMLTAFVIQMSRGFIGHWYLFVAGGIGSIIGAIYWYRSDKGRRQFDQILLKVPVIGDLVKKSSIARFSRTLGTLIASGVTIVDALEICSRIIGNSVIEGIIAESKLSITRGKTITAPMAQSGVIPDMVVQMIAVGEQTGALDDMLNKIADFYEEEVDTAVGSVTSIIEPVLMIFLGGIVAVLVIAMYLPIFNLAGALGG